jgi:hypothetical protein
MRVVLRSALAVAVLLAVPAWAAVPSTDLQAGADGAVGPVGATRTIYLHLYNRGPQDAPANAVTEEFEAPTGAILVGVGDGKSGPPVPAGCTWIVQDTDIRCVHRARIPSSMSADTQITIKIVSTITSPGRYLASCAAGLCVDPDSKNNSAPIVVNGVIHGPDPTPTPTRTPSASPTPTVGTTPTKSPSPTPTKSPTPSAVRTTASPSRSPSSGSTGAGPTPVDSGTGASGTGDSGEPAALPQPPDHGGDLDFTGVVWIVLGGTLVLVAGATLLLMRRPPRDAGENTDDLGDLLGQ